MRDNARIIIEVEEDGSTLMRVDYLDEPNVLPPAESMAMLQANVMVALFQTELHRRGPDGLVQYVEDHSEIWNQQMEATNADGSPVGEPIWDQDSKKLGK